MDRKWQSQISMLLLITTISLTSSEKNLRQRNRRLVGGRNANYENWGFLAKIKYKAKANVSWKICSASLIGSRWLLTAAHCIRDVDKKSIKADDFVVSIRHDQDFRKTTDYAVSKLAMPTNKDLRNGIRYTMFDKDVALIMLKDKVPSNVPRIPLHGHWKNAEMKSCKVAGWGSSAKMAVADIFTKNYELSKSLQEIDVSLLSFKEFCKNVNENGKICMGSIGEDGDFLNGACIGDSGSPVICENDRGKYLTGIVVGGSGTCEPLSLIVTNLNAYTTWIRKAKLILSIY